MTVEVASDGESAMRSIEASPPEMVLLDVLLPGRSGFEICERLKSDPATALIPVILVTALEDHESRVRGIQAGADDFLSKPVRREELLARVQNLRRLHETRRELDTFRRASPSASSAAWVATRLSASRRSAPTSLSCSRTCAASPASPRASRCTTWCTC
jgi:DNA-binding response OmpR family regulator